MNALHYRHWALRYRHWALLPLLLAVNGCSVLRDDIQLGSPDSLWLLWLVPALAAFYVYVFRTKTRLLRRFASAGLLPRLTASVSRARQGLKAVLVTVGLAAAVLTLAEPRWGFTWEEVERQGVDILVALDVSDSMLVEDVESGGGLSRLERAKREITDLLRLLEGDRIGLVAFAGTAFLECPLTLDHGAAELFLEAMDTDLLPVKGTNLGDAIDTSMRAFEGGNHTSQAIILITDGEDHSGRAEAAAQAAAEAGVRIFTVGIGRDEGAPIPAAGGGFRRDRRGEIVLSRLDETTLRKIAGATGGAYVRSVTGDVDLEQIYLQGIKANLEDRELGSQRRKRWEERFQWMLAVALAALVLEPLLSERRRIPAMPTTAPKTAEPPTPAPTPAPTSAPTPKPSRAAGVLLLLLLSATIPTLAQDNTQDNTGQDPSSDPYDVPVDATLPENAPSTVPAPPPDNPYDAYQGGHYQAALAGFTDQQVERPEDPQLWLNIGAANYKIRDFEAADTAFHRAAASAEPEMRHQAFYNLGNSAFRQGKLDEAVEHFKAALDIDPDDEDAKFNLEFVRDEIRRRHEEAQKRQQEQQQNQDQQDQQQGQDGQQDQDGQQGQDQQEQQQDQDGQQGQDQQEQQQGQQDQQDQQQAGGTDRDQDGLPDETERQGANPTDPNNPDSDGDGLPDGLEDKNQNGQRDEGETDPNNPDSDGDGTPDGQEVENQAAAQAAQRAAELAGQPQEGMTPEQAARYLQALEEERPEDPRRGKRVRGASTEKDW